MSTKHVTTTEFYVTSRTTCGTPVIPVIYQSASSASVLVKLLALLAESGVIVLNYGLCVKSA